MAEVKRFDPVERTRKFLSTINPHSRIALLHDNDPDGVCSGVLMQRLIRRATGNELAYRQGSPHAGLTKDILDQLNKNGITHLITCDVSTDNEPVLVKQAEKRMHILALDHHKLLIDINSEKTVLIKPDFFWNNPELSKYCTSKLAYDIGNAITDLHDSEWIALIGTITDICWTAWMEWVRAVFQRYHEKLTDDIFNNKFGRAGQYINDSFSYDDKLEGAIFNAVSNAKHVDDLLDGTLKKYHATITMEQQNWIAKFKKDAEKYPDAELEMLRIESPYRIKSSVNTILSLHHYPDRTIILYDLKDGVVGFSARDQRGTVPLNDILQNSIKGLADAGGGGHIKASGGHCREQDWQVVKQRIIHQLRELHASK